ncbi:hypothetical protein GCM10025863_07520 [Microbacterium suwonense]|uniref:Uncharacterized protein n=1 Tax=Microbacterium suwonense TaxID=683047 RepID=A0ABM8FRV1_9MICO|nr:hypothetical protein GCM10025863_07520 [Microbacterium suwonense]
MDDGREELCGRRRHGRVDGGGGDGLCLAHENLRIVLSGLVETNATQWEIFRKQAKATLTERVLPHESADARVFSPV